MAEFLCFSLPERFFRKQHPTPSKTASQIMCFKWWCSSKHRVSYKAWFLVTHDHLGAAVGADSSLPPPLLPVCVRILHVARTSQPLDPLDFSPSQFPSAGWLCTDTLHLVNKRFRGTARASCHTPSAKQGQLCCTTRAIHSGFVLTGSVIQAGFPTPCYRAVYWTQFTVYTKCLQDNNEQLISNRNNTLPCSRQGQTHYATQGDRDQTALGALLVPWAARCIFCKQGMLLWFCSPSFPTFQEISHWTWPHILLRTLRFKPPEKYLKLLSSFPEIQGFLNNYFVSPLKSHNTVLQLLQNVKQQHFLLILNCFIYLAARSSS